MYIKDTIISTITPVTGGSVSLLRVSGENSIELTNRYFSSHDLSKSKGGSFYFGSLNDLSNSKIDEVIVYIFRKPKSYTGENIVEISCHGNVFIVEEILNLYLKDGCRIAEPGEFTKRAFLNGKMDLLQAEAVADLIASKSKASVKNSLQLLEGRLSKHVYKLKKNLVDIASLLELELDFSEEGLEIISKEKYLNSVSTTIEGINKLLNSYNNAREFKNGVEILIAGKPNVGKSSLMNAFLERDRVIVSHIPGTTRDLVHEDIILDDIMVRLIDTAGIRFTKDHIEAEGVSRARKLLETGNLILIVIDISEALDDDDIEIINNLIEKKRQKIIIVCNKTDIGINPDADLFIKKLGIETILISAKEEQNIDILKQKITNRIKKYEIELAENIIISNKRQYEILLAVKDILNRNSESFLNNEGFEFIAADLRLAINKFSEITGEITTDDILNNIFSSFCIGK